MRICTKLLLCTSLPLAGILVIACDDMELGDSSFEDEDEDGPIEFRTIILGGGGLGNTNLVAGTPLVHHDEGTFPTAVIQEEGGWYHKFTGATCPVYQPPGPGDFIGTWVDKLQFRWEVLLSGEIIFDRTEGPQEFPTTVRTGGLSVKGCSFTLSISNNANFQNGGGNIAKTGKLTIIDVATTPINNKNTGQNPGSRYKYLMGVPEALKAPNAPMLQCTGVPDDPDLCVQGTEIYSTCVPDGGSDGSMWMGARYGSHVTLSTNTWKTQYGISQFLCHESVHGKFMKWGVPNSTFYNYPQRSAAVSAAVGLYRKGEYTTNLGNQIVQRTHNVWAGFDQFSTVPGGYAKEGAVQVTPVGGGSYTAEYACRGNSTSSWYSVNRNAGTSAVDRRYDLDWDAVDPEEFMPGCDAYMGNAQNLWDIVTFAKCQVSGTAPNIIQTCVP